MKPRQINFGDLRIGDTARKYIDRALSKNWISEGDNVAKFEAKFAKKFGWKHAIATSSGTTAGEVAWSAIRELSGCPRVGSEDREEAVSTVLTPSCAFVSTANCLLAAGIEPRFIDIDLSTLNLDTNQLLDELKYHYENVRIENSCTGIQFVATLGKPTPIKEIAKIANDHDLYLIGDWCEAHGCGFIEDESERCGAPGPHFFTRFKYADHFCDAAIYSFYAAHLIVAGEGGMICTDDDEIAELCRSIKCHGYGPGPRFDFRMVGFNAKMNELTAAVGIEGLMEFDENFKKRRAVRAGLIERLVRFEDRLILYRDAPGEIIAPHAFSVVLRDESADVMPLYHHMESEGIQVKSLFGSLATQHAAFAFMGHRLGEFLVAERVGRTGIHFGCHQFMTEDDLDYITEVVEDGLKKFYGA